MVVFLSGLPLDACAKNPADGGDQAAYKQLQTYGSNPSLFAYNAVLVASDGLEVGSAR